MTPAPRAREEATPLLAPRLLRVHDDLRHRRVLRQRALRGVGVAEDLVEGLLNAIKKCGRPKNSEDLALRISAYGFLRHPRAKEEAIKTITPPYPFKQEDTDRVMQSFALLACDKLVADSLSKFIWNCESLQPEHLAQLEALRPLPKSLEQALENYKKKTP